MISRQVASKKIEELLRRFYASRGSARRRVLRGAARVGWALGRVLGWVAVIGSRPWGLPAAVVSRPVHLSGEADLAPGPGLRRPPCCAATLTVKARRAARRARAAGPSVRWCPGLGATVVERAAKRSGRGAGAGCWQAAPFLEHLVCGVVAGQASLLG